MVLAALYFLVLIAAAALLGILWLVYKGLTFLWHRSFLRVVPTGLTYLWHQVFEGTDKDAGEAAKETPAK